MSINILGNKQPYQLVASFLLAILVQMPRRNMGITIAFRIQSSFTCPLTLPVIRTMTPLSRLGVWLSICCDIIFLIPLWMSVHILRAFALYLRKHETSAAVVVKTSYCLFSLAANEDADWQISIYYCRMSWQFLVINTQKQKQICLLFQAILRTYGLPFLWY